MYGTLLAGERNHRLLAHARLLGAARTRPTYALHDFGPYPAMVRGGAHAVPGEVYEVDAATLAALDHLEEHPDVYQRRRIKLQDGLVVWTYLMPRALLGAARLIPTGSWRQRPRRRRAARAPLRHYPAAAPAPAH